jgi:hypothetical protein
MDAPREILKKYIMCTPAGINLPMHLKRVEYLSARGCRRFLFLQWRCMILLKPFKDLCYSPQKQNQSIENIMQVDFIY